MEVQIKTASGNGKALTGVLVEALPYLNCFRDKTVVIKYGGAAQTEDALKDAFAEDVVLLSRFNIRPVIVHGGGKEISKLSGQLGIPSTFVNGQRVTSREMLDVVIMVLGGKVNNEIVRGINRRGGSAVGISGADAGLLRVRRSKAENGDDLGWVGEIEKVNPGIIEVLLGSGFVPVISPIGWGEGGKPFNINADLAASGIARSIRAEKLIYISDVPGVMVGGRKISTLRKAAADRHLSRKAITGGMIPKVRSAFETLKGGVEKVHLIDGRIPHALLLELFTDEGIGTQFIKD